MAISAVLTLNRAHARHLRALRGLEAALIKSYAFPASPDLSGEAGNRATDDQIVCVSSVAGWNNSSGFRLRDDKPSA